MNQEQRANIDATMKDARRQIWVTFQKEGIHKYPAALEDPKLATGDWDDVSFLGYPHRHMFHFKIGIDVFHNDRDIEFIQFSRWVQKLFGDGILSLDYKSCEMIAGKKSKRWKPALTATLAKMQRTTDW